MKNKSFTNLIFILMMLLFSSLSWRTISSNPGRLISSDTVMLGEVSVSALRTETPLRQLPASVSVITKENLSAFSKTIAPDEALRLVPGVKVENGTSGSRVHIYTRGQGLLSESGFRGIQVFLDGIPVNDPGGYCPDLYDVDWSTVSRVEVVRGLAASMYGAGANGGIINIITENGRKKPVSTKASFTAGSYGFWKIKGQVDGTSSNLDYRVTYSHAQGHGYREHQAYMADNFNEKVNWTPTSRVKISQTVAYTSYFNQNSEGINIYRYETYGPRAANTDAVPYNEFHETRRLTAGLTGKFDISSNQSLQVKGFARTNFYRETSNNGDDYKPYLQFGGDAQYMLVNTGQKMKNTLITGVDYQTQSLSEHMFAVPSRDQLDTNRIDSYWSRACFDLDKILVNQTIRQSNAGVFLTDKLDVGKKLHILLNLRYDYTHNKLDSHIPVPDSLNPDGIRDYSKPAWRIGVVYDIAEPLNLYAGFGTGFLTPSNDELYNNPEAYGGFNNLIKPSSSSGMELGVRGDIDPAFHYDLAGFNINTTNEFYRYSVPGRGNNTAFYGNMGKSNKWGVESHFSVTPVKDLRLEASYTYSHFRFTSPDSVDGNWLPNSPEHMLSAELSYGFLHHFSVALSAYWQSKWCIQVDDSIYNQYTIEQTWYQPRQVRSSWVDGYKVFSLDLHYFWKLGTIRGDLGFYVKNLLDEQYFGFTEPNNYPDYNSFQPAPGRELFLSLKLEL